MKYLVITVATMGLILTGCGPSGGGTKKADSGGTTTESTTEGATTEGATTEGATTEGVTAGATSTGAFTEGATTEGATDAGTTEGATTEGATDAGTTEGATDAGTTTGTDDCSSLSGSECVQCLAEENPTGAQAFLTALDAECICANECQTDCAASCGNPNAQPSPACDTCLNSALGNQQSACFTQFMAACQANPTCMQFAMALQACQ